MADDAPLRFTREPFVHRSNRWLRRNALRVAVAVPFILAPAAIAYGLSVARLERIRLVEEVKQLIIDGNRLIVEDDLDLAQAKLATAAELVDDGPHSSRSKTIRELVQQRTKRDAALAGLPNDPKLADLQSLARQKFRLAGDYKRIRKLADTLFRRSEVLRLQLLGLGDIVGDPSEAVEQTLAPFYVLKRDDWLTRPEISQLDEKRRTRLIGEINDLLFFWAINLEHLDNPRSDRKVLELCDRALAFAEHQGPWEALRQRCEARLAGQELHPSLPENDPDTLTSAQVCFQWGVLESLQGHPRRMIAWVDRAIRLNPERYWYHYYLAAHYHENEHNIDMALAHYNVAVALRRTRPWRGSTGRTCTSPGAPGRRRWTT